MFDCCVAIVHEGMLCRCMSFMQSVYVCPIYIQVVGCILKDSNVAIELRQDVSDLTKEQSGLSVVVRCCSLETWHGHDQHDRKLITDL